MFDCHTHTNFSTDSNMEIENLIKVSKELGIGTIITDHMDYKHIVPGEFIFDPDEYFNKYEKYRSDKLLLGVEIGFREDSLEKIIKLNQNYPFDFVIGSIHVVKGIDIYYREYYEGKTKKQAYDEYFGAVLSLVNHPDLFDSLGHIDYITRYSTYEDRSLYYKEYADQIDEVLKGLSREGKAIEINTRKINNKNVANTYIEILKRFRELKGQYITIGSDAHRLEDIGINFKIAKEITQMCKLKPVYYKQRKIHYI